MDKRHLIVIKVINEPGIFSRVANLFTQRGYNMETITAGGCEKPGYSRMTIVVIASDDILDQIQKQLYKLVEVEKVVVLDKQSVVREHVLVKVKADRTNRSEILEIANIYRAKVLNVTSRNLIVELTGDKNKIEGFLSVMEDFNILEIAKTGVSAMGRI